MIPGLPADRNRELAEQGLEIHMTLTAKYARAAKESAEKLGRDSTAETFRLIDDQVADAIEALHHLQGRLM